MAVFVLLVLILAMTGHSDATWCICRSDVSDAALQKTLDYACGAGADCSPIIQSGACYNPNTVRAHCSYAVNSYYQKKGQAQGSCEFSNTASVSTTDPSPGGTCTFPATASSSGTPSTTTPSTTTPSTPPSTTSPSTGTGTGTGTTPSSTLSPTTPSSSGLGLGTGLGPTGSGINTDTSDAVFTCRKINNLFTLLVTLWFSGLVFWLG